MGVCVCVWELVYFRMGLGVCVRVCCLSGVCLRAPGSAVNKGHAGCEPGGLFKWLIWRWGSYQLWPRLSLAHPLHTLSLRLLVSAHLQGLK